MGLFSISCETCCARLKVRSESAIGQVLACPKCGSMIQVQAPENWAAPSEQELAAIAQIDAKRKKRARDPNDSQATLSNDFGEIDSLLSDDAPSPSQAAPGKPSSKKSVPGQIQRTHVKQTTATNPTVKPTKPISAATATSREATLDPPIHATGDRPVLPNEDWMSKDTKRRRKAFTWVAGILAVCFVAIVLIGYLISQMIGGGSTGPVAKHPNGDSKTEVSANENSVSNDKSSDQSLKKDNSLENVNDSVVNDSEKSPPNIADDNSDGSPNPDDVVPDDLEKSQAAGTNDVKPSTDANVANDSVAEEPFDSNSDPNAVALNRENQNDESMINDLDDIPALIPGITMDQIRDATTDSSTERLGIGKVFVRKPSPSNSLVSKQLAEVYPAIQYEDISLLRLVRLFTDLTSVPIQLDSQAIMDGRIDPHQTVSINQTNASAQNMLHAALEPIGLELKITEDDAAVIITPASADKSVQKEHVIDPLIEADEKLLGQLVMLLQSTIDPTSWNVNDGQAVIEQAPGKLVIDQTEKNHRQIERMLSLLAAAKTLSKNPADANASELLASSYRRIHNLAEQSSAFEVLQNEPIGEILDQVERIDGLTVLVDWQSILPRGWNPKTEIPWPSKDQDVQSTMRDIVLSMGLVTRTLGDQILEITASEKLLNSTMLNVYPVGELLEKKFTNVQIIKFLENGIGASLPAAPVFTIVYFQPETQSVVAVLSEPLHIRAERILKQLAKSR